MRRARFGSVFSGAFVLAEAGLLSGCRVTTHWAIAEQLAARYPDVIVDPDAIRISDGKLRTAAGVTAGLDLALALVEEDLGREVAMDVASQLVMFFKRPGGQLQFSRKDEAVPIGRAALQELQRWIVANPAQDHSVANLAKRMELSARHFARLFRNEVASRRHRGWKRCGLPPRATCLNGGMMHPSRSHPVAVLPMQIRCGGHSRGMLA